MLAPATLGRYRLLRRIGIGGMAEVFQAKTEGVEGFERLFVLGAVRNVLAHRQEYEVDPEADLGEATGCLASYSLEGVAGQIVDIPLERLRALEADCLDVLRA